MRFKRLFGHSEAEDAARRLYAALLEQARRPVFYQRLGVPDTLDGRFDMIALHAFLVLHRLKQEGLAQGPVGQALFDLLFADMDGQLRELGVGDLSVGRKIKQMATGLYGRLASYEEGIAGAGGVLEQALRRNLYGTVEPEPGHVAAMADYTRRQAAHLQQRSVQDLLSGRLEFPQAEEER